MAAAAPPRARPRRAHPLPVRGRALAHPGARPQVAAQEGGQGGAQPRQEGGLHLPHPVHRLGRRGRPAEHGLIVRLTDRSMNGEAYAVDSAGLPARVIRRFVLFLWNQT